MARARGAALSSECPPATCPRAEAGPAPSLEPPGHRSSPVGAWEGSSALETPEKAAHPPAWSRRRHLQLPSAKSPVASGPHPSFLWIFPLQGAFPRSRLRTPRSFPGTRRPTDPCGLALLRGGGAQRGCFPGAGACDITSSFATPRFLSCPEAWLLLLPRPQWP